MESAEQSGTPVRADLSAIKTGERRADRNGHKFATASRGGTLGLNDDELARYDALARNEAPVRELGNEVLARIAHELTASLRQNLTVDWNNRDRVRAKLRLMVKRILRRYKWPPDQ